MKHKILAVIICIALVICSVFTTLKVSDYYDKRDEIINTIEADYINIYHDKQPIEIKKIVDLVELDDSVIAIFTVNEKYKNVDKICIAFLDKTKAIYSLVDCWTFEEEFDSNIQIRKFSDDGLFFSFAQSDKFNEKIENYTYLDYTIDAYGKKDNYTLMYKVSKEIEYPIYLKYEDFSDFNYFSTNLVAMYIDEDNMLYVATKNKNEYTDDVDSVIAVGSAEKFKKVYKDFKITQKQLDKQMLEKLYNYILQIAENCIIGADSDTITFGVGDCYMESIVETNYIVECEHSKSYKLGNNQRKFFDLLNQYLTFENVKIKNPLN